MSPRFTWVVGNKLKLLKKHGYTVVMTAVHASIRKCTSNGTSREKKEGKRYSSRAWSWTAKNVASLFNYSRSLGFKRAAYFIYDNTDWSNTKTVIVPPGMNVACDILPHTTEQKVARYSVHTWELVLFLFFFIDCKVVILNTLPLDEATDQNLLLFSSLYTKNRGVILKKKSVFTSFNGCEHAKVSAVREKERRKII